MMEILIFQIQRYFRMEPTLASGARAGWAGPTATGLGRDICESRAEA